jgi:hypothetical protein
MKGFLARWADGAGAPEQGPRRGGTETLPNAQVASESETTHTDLETLPDPRAMSWEEWKAGELNKLFGEQGATGKRGQLLETTIRHGLSRNERDGAHGVSSPHSVGDPTADKAIRESANLLATAYQRCSATRSGVSARGENSGDDELAKSSRTSVHGVVP